MLITYPQMVVLQRSFLQRTSRMERGHFSTFPLTGISGLYRKSFFLPRQQSLQSSLPCGGHWYHMECWMRWMSLGKKRATDELKRQRFAMRNWCWKLLFCGWDQIWKIAFLRKKRLLSPVHLWAWNLCFKRNRHTV